MWNFPFFNNSLGVKILLVFGNFISVSPGSSSFVSIIKPSGLAASQKRCGWVTMQVYWMFNARFNYVAYIFENAPLQ